MCATTSAVPSRKASGLAATYVHLDVTSQDDWRNAVEFTQGTFGNPDILVCNAGIMLSGPFEKASPDDFRRAFETNAMGAVHGIQAVLDPMRASGGGSIVILSSVAGQVGIEGLSAYCTSKAANTMIARCAAIELAQYNIRVNSDSSEQGRYAHEQQRRGCLRCRLVRVRPTCRPWGASRRRRTWPP